MADATSMTSVAHIFTVKYVAELGTKFYDKVPIGLYRELDENQWIKYIVILQNNNNIEIISENRIVFGQKVATPMNFLQYNGNLDDFEPQVTYSMLNNTEYFTILKNSGAELVVISGRFGYIASSMLGSLEIKTDLN